MCTVHTAFCAAAAAATAAVAEAVDVVYDFELAYAMYICVLPSSFTWNFSWNPLKSMATTKRFAQLSQLCMHEMTMQDETRCTNTAKHNAAQH